VHGTTAHDLEAVMSEALDKVEEIQAAPSLVAMEQTAESLANPLHFA
jgi:hypothetical protein